MFILDLFGYSGHIIGFLLFFGCIWCDLRLRNPPSPRPPPLGLCLKFYIPKLCEKWKRYEIEWCIYIITVTSSCPKLLCSIRFQIAAEVWETTLAANKRTEWLVSTPTDAFSNTLHCIALHRGAHVRTWLHLLIWGPPRLLAWQCVSVSQWHSVWHGRWNLLREEQNQVNSWLGSSWHDTNLTIIT